MSQHGEVCANCGRSIGRLEQAFLWRDHGVCAECYDRLSRTGDERESLRADSKRGGSAAPTLVSAPASGASDSVKWAGSPSVNAYLPGYFLLATLCLPFVVLMFANNACFAVAIPLFAFPILFWELQRRATSYLVTERRAVAEWGVIGKERREIHISDVRLINMRQDIIARIVGVGTVELGTAATAGIEIEIKNVADPRSLAALLESLRLSR